MKKNRKKDILLVFLCLCLLLIGVGYSILTQRLVIHGSTKITGKFDVRITSIEPTQNKTKKAINNHCEVVNYISASFTADLTEPSDYIEYLVTIKNFGNLDADLKSTMLTLTETDYIKFETYGDAIDNPVLLAGEETTIKIMVKFKNTNYMPDNEHNIASTTLILNYVQKK